MQPSITTPNSQGGLISQLYPHSFAGSMLGQNTAYTTPSATPDPMAQAAPQQQKPKGNFLTHSLPTIGGILGGLVSLPAEALDLVSGVGGTALNIAGAGAGAGIGKALENHFEGNSLGSGVLANAAEGAIGQGVGAGLGKVAGAVAGGVGTKASELAPGLLKGQLAKGALGANDAGKLLEYGVTDSSQFPKIADIVTGQNGALNHGVEKTLMTAGAPTEVSDLVTTGGKLLRGSGVADNLIANETALGDTASKKIIGSVQKSVQNMLGGSQGMIGKQLADPLDVLQESRQFGNLAAKAQELANSKNSAEQQAVANVYRGLADELNTRVFSPNGSQIAIPDEIKSEVIAKLAPLKDINPSTYNTLVQNVSNAKTLTDLRSLQAPFVQGNKAFQATARATDKGAGVTGSQLTSSLPVPVMGGGGTMHGALLGLAGSGLRNVADKPIAINAIRNGGDILSSIGQSQAPELAGGSLGTIAGTSNNLIQQPGVNPTGENTMLPSTTTPQQAMPESPDAAATRQALLALAFYSPGALSSLVPSATQQQGVASALSAESALNGLGQAPGGGLLSSLEAHLGVGGTGAYQKRAESTAEQVAQAIPGADKDAILKQLTGYMQGKGNIAGNVQDLLSRLNAIAQSNQTTGLQGILGFNNAPQTMPGTLATVQ